MTRLAAISLAIALSFTLVHYVRRAYIPPARSSTTPDGSRDRTLSGKARVRARRHR